jgi:hypothetical protein
MKELLATGAVVTVLTLFGTETSNNSIEPNHFGNVLSENSEGFVPHDRVTLPVQEMVPDDKLLPDFGSQAYL